MFIFNNCLIKLQDVFIVETILAKKKFEGTLKYLVKWLNYPLAQASWKPVENIPLDLRTQYDEMIVPASARIHYISEALEECKAEAEEAVLKQVRSAVLTVMSMYMTIRLSRQNMRKENATCVI